VSDLLNHSSSYLFKTLIYSGMKQVNHWIICPTDPFKTTDSFSNHTFSVWWSHSTD